LGIPGAPVDVWLMGNLICVATTWMNVSEVMPASRACANASSRFGPTVPFVPASASVWQPPHACTKSFLPDPWLPELTYPPVPQPARATTSAPAHATAT
jgi:hypothetical protein